MNGRVGGGTPLNENRRNVAVAINNFFNNGGVLPAGFMNLSCRPHRARTGCL
jgi:hypothetical protein